MEKRDGVRMKFIWKRAVLLVMALALATPNYAYAQEGTKEVSLAESSDSGRSEKKVEQGVFDKAQIFSQITELVKARLLLGNPTEGEFGFVGSDQKETVSYVSVDISQLKLTSQQVTAVELSELTYYIPYCVEGVSILYVPQTVNGYYKELVFRYETDIAQVQSNVALLDEKIEEIYDLIDERSMSDEYKALLVHDYLIGEFEYDQARLETNTLPQESYRSGGLLKNKTGVCQAYAYLYMYMMHKAGIACEVISSETMNHAWNIVQIDGQWYHVDCTWDDPVPDRLGRVMHNNFLLSDAAIATAGNQSGHTGWEKPEGNLTDTRYDNAWWRSVETQIVMEEDDAYYIDGSERQALVKRDLKTQKITELVTGFGKWYAWNQSTSFYQDIFSSISFYDGYLYYNTATGIYKTDLDGKQTEMVEMLDLADAQKGYIYGSRIRGEVLEYVLQTEPNTTEKTVKELQLVQTPTEADAIVSSVELTETTFLYTGNPIDVEPYLVVKDTTGKTLSKGIDYEVKKSSTVYLPGVYTIAVTFKGKYKGNAMVSRSYDITPAAVCSAKATWKEAQKEVVFTWDAVPGVSGYEVSYRVGNGTFQKYGNLVSQCSFTLGNVTQGTQYEVKVSAVWKNSDKILVGEEGSAQIAVPSAQSTTPVVKVGTVSNVKAVLCDYNAVKISWKKVSGANAYRVYYKASTDKKYKLWKQVTGTSVECTKLSQGVKYSFQIEPCKVNGSTILAKGTSKTVSATTLKKMSAPTVKKASSGKAKVSWKSMSGMKGYQISVSTSKKKTTLVYTGKKVKKTAKTLKAKKGKKYYYKVRAYVVVAGKTIYTPWSNVTACKIK